MKRRMHAVLRLSFANAKGIFADDGETRPHQARWRAGLLRRLSNRNTARQC